MAAGVADRFADAAKITAETASVWLDAGSADREMNVAEAAAGASACADATGAERATIPATSVAATALASELAGVAFSA